MSEPVALGIDFGTSNSAVAAAFSDGRVKVLPVGDAVMPHSLPSIAYLHRDGNRLAGEEAVNEYLITGRNRTHCRRCPLVVSDLGGRYSECRQYTPDGFCSDSRLLYGLKSELADDSFQVTHSWAHDFTMPDLVAVVLRHLKQRAEQQLNQTFDTAVIGAPVAFVGTESERFDDLQDLAEERLREGAIQAGFQRVDLFPEPAAAILDQPLDPGIAVSLDFGGGTFDVAVIRMEASGHAEVIGLQGAAVGGLEFDGLLFDFVVADQIGVDDRLPARIRRDLRTLMGVRSLLSSSTLFPGLAAARARGGDTEAIEELLFGGHAYAFYKAIESAKTELSSREAASISFSRPGLRVNADVSRSDFEQLLSPYLNAVEEAVRNALDEGGVAPAEVQTAIRTGGSSEIPAFLDRMRGLLPQAKFRRLPVLTAVAEGLGKEAYMRWAA